MSNIENMTEEQLQHKLYDLYQLDWMMYQGHSLTEIIKGMEERHHDDYVFEKDRGKQVDVSGIYKAWESGRGFGGDIFLNFNEFCESQYRDVSYMYQLMETQPVQLSEELKERYDDFMERKYEPYEPYEPCKPKQDKNRAQGR